MALTDKLTAIGDAIREKTASTDLISLSEMPDKVGEVYNAGVEEGKSQGGDTEAAYEAGKKAEYDKFWDSFQQNGNLTNYKYAFAGNGWNANAFYPKYDIIPITSAESMFSEFGGGAFSLTQRLNDHKKTMDFSNVTGSAANAFYNTPFEEIPYLNLEKTTGITRIFYSCDNLVTAGLYIKDGLDLTRLFDNCSNLKNLTIGGTISKNGFNVSYSKKLSKVSIYSILFACNKNVEGQGISITLPSNCIDGATNTLSMLENFDNNFEFTRPTLDVKTVSLGCGHIAPSSVTIIPVNEDGEQVSGEWQDDGNGIIIHTAAGTEKGTINYETGMIEFYEPIQEGSYLDYGKFQFSVAYDPYHEATENLGYSITFK